MTKQEVNKLLALMRANYGSAFKGMSQPDKYLLLNTWTFTLQDLDANIVMIAAMELISTSKWLPTVAEIREQCKKLHYEAVGAMCDYHYDALPEWKKKAYCSIAEKTNRLRGDGTAEMTLDVMLDDPELAALATGHEHKMLMDGMDDTSDEKPQR